MHPFSVNHFEKKDIKTTKYPNCYAFGYAVGKYIQWIFLLSIIAILFSLLWSKVSGPFFAVPEPWSNPGWWNTMCIFWLAGVSKKLYRVLRYGV